MLLDFREREREGEREKMYWLSPTPAPSRGPGRDLSDLSISSNQLSHTSQGNNV